MTKHKHGFTVVELIVVIVVIAVLATIATISYRHVQITSRDNKRAADITAFRSALEKFYDQNGVYPPGCHQTPCAPTAITNNTITSQLNASASFATAKEALPTLPNGFGDPSTDNSSSLFLSWAGAATPTRKYFYFGGGVGTSSWRGSYSRSASSQFPCTLELWVNYPTNAASSYVTGYFSESQQKWILFGGKQGNAITLGGNASDGCTINP